MRKSTTKIINAIIYIVLSSCLINADDNSVDEKTNVTSSEMLEYDGTDDVYIQIDTKDIELLGGEDITIDYFIISNHKKTLKFKYKIGGYSCFYDIPKDDPIPSPPCSLSLYYDGHYGEEIERIHTLNQYQYLSGKTKIQTPDRKGVYDLNLAVSFTFFIYGKKYIETKRSRSIKVIVINNPKNTNGNAEERQK